MAEYASEQPPKEFSHLECSPSFGLTRDFRAQLRAFFCSGRGVNDVLELDSGHQRTSN